MGNRDNLFGKRFLRQLHFMRRLHQQRHALLQQRNNRRNAEMRLRRLDKDEYLFR